jgi:hypothetical protein
MPRTESSSSWLRTSRHLLAGFLIVTLGPACGLVWLGWKLLDQDRDLASQRLQERRERAADLAVSSLQQRLVAAENVLLGPTAEPPSGPFLDAERLEFHDQDREAAIKAATPLTRAPDLPTRAGAHLLLARNLRKAGKPEAALGEYGELARCAGVANRPITTSAWSPDGRQLLYTTKDRIWKLNLETGKSEEVQTGLTVNHLDMAWSPDGRTIAFAGLQDGEAELWLMEDFLSLVKGGK